MSLEKILEKIAGDAEAESEKIIQESRDKAEEIKKKAKMESGLLAESIMIEAEKQGEMEANRLVTQARLAKRIELLECKKQLIDEVLDKAFQDAVPGGDDIKRTIIMKDGEKEEIFQPSRLKEEIRPRLENMIAKILKI